MQGIWAVLIFFKKNVTIVVEPSSYDIMTINQEKVIIEEILNGNTRVFSQLVDGHKDLVFSLALRMLKNREEAEEVAQDTFIKVYKSIAKFKMDSKLSTWIYKITYRTCLDRIKKNKKHLNDVPINEFTENEIKSIDNALERMMVQERKQNIQNCIQKLESDDAALLTLYYFDELSLQEMSEILKLSTNNIKVKLFRCRKKLAEILITNLEPEIITTYGK